MVRFIFTPEKTYDTTVHYHDILIGVFLLQLGLVIKEKLKVLI